METNIVFFLKTWMTKDAEIKNNYDLRNAHSFQTELDKIHTYLCVSKDHHIGNHKLFIF